MDLLIRLIADGFVVVVFIVGFIVYITSIKDSIYQQYTRAFMAGLTAYAIAKILSLFYETIERPFVTLGVEPKAAYLDNPGFPSDHALFAMTITLVVWAATRRDMVGVTLLTLTTLVGVGRIIALVHTPQDVLGGYAAAVLGVGLWYKFFRRS